MFASSLKWINGTSFSVLDDTRLGADAVVLVLLVVVVVVVVVVLLLVLAVLLVVVVASRGNSG